MDMDTWAMAVDSAIINDVLPEFKRLLAERGARLDIRFQGGCGLAQVAAYRNRLEHLRHLKLLNCPMEVPDNDGDTALTEAASCGHLEVVRFLLDEAAADPNWRNHSGCTALHAACEWKHLAVAKLLLDRDALPNLLDEAKNSPLHALAAKSPNQQQKISQTKEIADLMQTLVTMGVKLDQENSRGYTPLMKCIATGHWSLLPHLLSASQAGTTNKHGVNLAHVFYAHHDNTDSSRRARQLLTKSLPYEWDTLCTSRVNSGRQMYSGYTSVHFACEFCRLSWLPDLLSSERTDSGESAIDILARRHQLSKLRERCRDAQPAVWREMLPLLDPVLEWTSSRSRTEKARQTLWPLCDNDEHDSGRLFRAMPLGAGVSYVSGLRYRQTGGQENREYPLALKLLVAAIGHDNSEAFVSLLELGHLNGTWSKEFCCDLHLYLTSGGGLKALSTIGNGLDQLEEKHLNGVEWLDPLDLAVTLGRSRIVKEMLLARQFDLVPSCLRVLHMCRRMGSVRHRCVGDMRDCAQSILVNALNSLHDGVASDKDKRRVDAYINGEFELKKPGPVFSDISLPVLRSVKKLEGNGMAGKSTPQFTVLQLLLTSGCDEALSTKCIRMLVKRRWMAQTRCSTCGCRSLSPFGKFILHVASLAVFTCLLTLFLTGGRSKTNFWHFAILAVLLAFALDHLVLGCHVLHFTKRQFPNFYGATRGIELLLPALLQLISLVGMVVNWATGLGGDTAGYYLHLILATSYLLLSIRWLFYLTVFRHTGPTVSILWTLIVDDLMPFMSIFLLVTVAFGVLFHSVLYPHSRQFRASDGKPFSISPLHSLVDIYSRPLFLAFGEFQIDSLRPCEQRTDNCSGLAGIDCLCPHEDGLRLYLALFVHLYLFVNLALLNLLIAKFSLTVNTKVEQAFVIWNKHRMLMLCEYQMLPNLPPPFSGLNLITSRLITPNKCQSCRCVASESSKDQAADLWSHWENFSHCRRYLKYLWLQAIKFRGRRKLFLRKVRFQADGNVLYTSN